MVRIDPLAAGLLDDDGAFKSLPVQVRYPIFILPTFLIMIVVSLFTKQHDQKSVDEFYCRLDTPVGDEQKIRDAGFTVDRLETLSSQVETQEISEKARNERLLIADLFYLPKLISSGKAKWSNYKTDFVGLIGSIILWWPLWPVCIISGCGSSTMERSRDGSASSAIVEALPAPEAAVPPAEALVPTTESVQQ